MIQSKSRLSTLVQSDCEKKSFLMMGSCKHSDAERFRPIMDSDFSNQEGSTDLPFKLDFFLIHLYLAHIHFRLKILHLRVKISIKVHSSLFMEETVQCQK